jgi:hypothetical protein
MLAAPLRGCDVTPAAGPLARWLQTGFRADRLTRGDIEAWFAGKHVHEAVSGSRSLRLAMIAGWAGVAGAVVGVASIAVTVWLAKMKHATNEREGLNVKVLLDSVRSNRTDG